MSWSDSSGDRVDALMARLETYSRRHPPSASNPATFAILVLAIDGEGASVSERNPDARDTLERLIELGYEPIALGRIAVRGSCELSPGALAFSAKTDIDLQPFAEYAEEEWVERVLYTFAGDLRRQLESPEHEAILRTRLEAEWDT